MNQLQGRAILSLFLQIYTETRTHLNEVSLLHTLTGTHCPILNGARKGLTIWIGQLDTQYTIELP